MHAPTHAHTNSTRGDIIRLSARDVERARASGEDDAEASECGLYGDNRGESPHEELDDGGEEHAQAERDCEARR